MNRSKRLSSCPNLSRLSKTRENEFNNPALLRRINRQCERHVPRVLGHPIKLSDLFMAVVVRGGYRLVCEKRLWSDLASELSLPSACTNSAIALRRIYHQYLIRHELTEYPGLNNTFLTQSYTDFPSSDLVGSQLSFLPASTVERNLGIASTDVLASPPLHSNYHSLTDITDGLRQSTQRPWSNSQSMPCHTTGRVSPAFSDRLAVLDHPNSTSGIDWTDPVSLRDPSELSVAELSLASGLPNEIDVTLNSLLALSVTPNSSTGASTCIRLAHCRNLLNLMLATVGVYDDGIGSLVICDPDWRQQTQLNFLRFWHNVIEEPEGRIFLRPDVFITADDSDEVSRAAHTELFAPFPTTHSHSRLFHLCDAVEESVECSRVQLVATLLVNLVTPPLNHSSSHRLAEDDDDASDYDVFIARSLLPHSPPLSTWRENARCLAASPTALRFAFLCAYARHSGLQQLGMQLISSLRYPLDPPMRYPSSMWCPLEWTPLMDQGCRLGDLTLSFLNHCLLRNVERTSLIGGLNLLANLATVPEKANEVSLLSGLPPCLWSRLAQLICIPDLAVVCATLEALRCLTNLGSYACMLAWNACLDECDLISSPPLILLQPLVALLTLEGQAMGSQSLHRIKLVQRTPQPAPHLAQYAQPAVRAPRSSHLPLRSSEWSSPHPLPPSSPMPIRSHQQTISFPRPNYQQSLEHAARSFNNLPSRQMIHPFSVRLNPSFTNCTFGIGSKLVSPPPPPVHSLTAHCRPVGVSVNCAGLINLLTSSTAPSSSATSVVTSISTTNTCLSVMSSQPPIKPVVASSGTPTSSELTDRLQMPPPSLPPPSVLRRSTKLSHTRLSTSLSSPLSLSRSQTSPNSTCSSSENETTGASDQLVSRVITAVSDCEDAPVTPTSDRKCSFPPDANRLSASEQSVGDETQKLDVSQTEKVEEDCRILSNGNQNGEPTADLGTSTEHSLAPSVKPEKPLPLNRHLNGVRPGILQAAMDVLQNKTFNDIKLIRDGNLESHIGLANGLQEDPASLMLQCHPKKTHETSQTDAAQKCSDSCGSSISQSLKPSDLACTINGYLKRSHMESFMNDDICLRPTTKPEDNQATPLLVNGTCSSESGSSSGSSEHETPSKNSRFSNESRQRLLKRRRPWGSRDRFFTPKRRRKYVRSSAKVVVTSGLSDASRRISSLKPLPLRLDPLPDSVLGPAWKPLWDPIEHSSLSTASGKPPRPEHTTAGDKHLINDTLNQTGYTEKPVTECSISKYICEWETCFSLFDDKDEVSTHVYHTHLHSRDQQPLVRRRCRWRGCPSASLPRAPFALMTHVLDVHCNPAELSARKTTSENTPHSTPSTDAGSTSSPVPSTSSIANLCQLGPTVPPDPHLASPGDQSAWSVIRSIEMRQMHLDLWAAHHHHLAFVSPQNRYAPTPPPPAVLHHVPPTTPPREGPVTKHLRVTAALVLRNFVTHVEEARSWFTMQLPLLSELVMGCSPSDGDLRTNDAASIIAQCLAICIRMAPRDNPVQSFLQSRLFPSMSARLTWEQPTNFVFRHSVQRRPTHEHVRTHMSNVDMDARTS